MRNIKFHFSSLQRLLGLLGDYKTVFLVSVILCAMVDPLYRIGFAFVNKMLFNAIEFSQFGMFTNAAILMGVIFTIYSVVQPITAYYFEGGMYRPLAKIRLRLLQKISQLPLSFFDKHHSGDLMSRITTDIDSLTSFYKGDVYDILSTWFWGMGSLVAMYWLDWRLASLMVVLGFCAAVVGALYTERLAEIILKIRQHYGGLNTQLMDMVTGLRTIKIFQIHTPLYVKYAKEVDQVCRLQGERAGLNAKKAALGFVISTLNFVGAICIAAIMVAHDMIDFGTAIGVILLQDGIVELFTKSGIVYTQFFTALASASRIFEILDTTTEEDLWQRQGGDTPSKVLTADMIVFRGVHFSYQGGPQILDDVSFSVARHQTTVLVGMSGGGKTTIFRLLLGFYQPTLGDIYIAGRHVAQYTLPELREMFSYVPQQPDLLVDTVEANIRMGKPAATIIEIEQAAKAAYAHEFITALPQGYQTVLEEGGRNLSGGQRQRIAIARAILKSAPIILLDEATSALDNTSEQRVHQALENLMQNSTVFAIAHRQTLIARADKVLRCEQAKVKEVS